MPDIKRSQTFGSLGTLGQIALMSVSHSGLSEPVADGQLLVFGEFASSGRPARFRGSLRSECAPAEAPGHAVERVPYL